MPNHLNRDEVIVSEHLADLRSRVRWLMWISGIAWTTLVLFGGLLISGVLDWMIHFDDPGLRLVIGVSLLAAAGVMAWRQLIRPLLQPLTTSFLALRIERRFPGLHSRVVSAVEFLQHRLDPKLGSPELQQAVVKNALRDLEKIETNDVVETKAVKRIAIAGAILGVIIATVVVLHPVEAGTSVKRLMFPFANCPWPRQFELKLVRPDMSPVVQSADKPMLIARGDTLELYVVGKHGRLPERVWFEHRIGDDEDVKREPLRQTTLRDEKGRTSEAAVISWVAGRGPLTFRAIGGDDDTMAFQRVEVVQPPTLESLRVTVTPPKYCGRPAETLPQGVGHVAGLLGTEVSIQAVSDKPLKSAQLRVADKPAKALQIAEDQLSFTATFKVTDPGVTGYWFELTDLEGFNDPESPRFELRGIADSVPDIVIEDPVVDMIVSEDVELPVKILAKDDLGLRSVRISYTLNEDPAQVLIPLITHDDPEPLTLATPDYLWKLADLKLKSGDRIVFRAEAIDAYDLTTEPHIGRSSPRTITIVSKQEKQKELAGRVGDLLEELQQAAALQQRAKQQTEDVQTQLKTAGELRAQDLDQLHGIELNQRQAASRLNRPADGVQSQAQQLQDEFQANKLDDAEMQQRLKRIVDELFRLDKEQFPEIESALTRASKQAEAQVRPDSQPSPGSTDSKKPSEPKAQQPPSKEGTPKDGNPADKPENKSPTENAAKPTEPPAPQKSKNPELDSALTDAHSHQSRAGETLQELQDLLSEWRDQRDVSRELNSLITEQDQLQKESAELGQQTLSKSATDLTPQQKADLAKMATRQMKVAERVDQFRKQLQQAADSLKERDQDSSERFNDAKDELNSDGTASKLREAARDIAENQIGTASQMQQQALQDLKDLDKQLKHQPTDDVETLIKQIEQVQQEFEMLRKEQIELQEKTQQAASQPNSPQKTEQLQQLRQQQKELTDKINEAERRLERLRLRPPTEAAERAQERLDHINQQLQNPDQAGDAAEEMQQVVDDLEQVQRDLSLEKRVAQERLAIEELERIEDQLKSLQAQQKGLIAETERLETERLARGSLSRGQLKTLRDLADVERGLQADAEQMEKSLKVAEVFSLVLRRTARSLKLAADRLVDKQSDAAVVTLEKDALKKIESLLLVLKTEEPKAPPKTEQGQQAEATEPEGEQKPQQSQPPGEALPQLAQLKLLKALQEEFLERTELLDALRDKDGKLPEDAAKELEELAKEQAELADLAREMVVKILHQRPDVPDAKPEPAKDEKPKESDKPKVEPKQPKEKSDLDELDLDSLDPSKAKKSSTGKVPGAKEE